jgi:hypothetical protein
MAKQFRTKTTTPSYPEGVPIYNNGSAREQLTAMLNRNLTNAPSFEDTRSVAEQAEQAKVDAASIWGSLRQLAVNVRADAKNYADVVAAELNNMYPDVFNDWKTQADEEFAGRLVFTTSQYFDLLEKVPADFPKPAIPVPVTGPDINLLSIRLGLLQNATPSEAAVQILDGIARGDNSYMVAAASNLRSWLSYRNSWQTQEAEKIAFDLLDKIAIATWSPETFAAQYAQETADKFRDAWQFFISPIAAGNFTVEQTDIDTGALEPLFSPKPKKPARKSQIQFRGDEIIVTDALTDDDSGE